MWSTFSSNFLRCNVLVTAEYKTVCCDVRKLASSKYGKYLRLVIFLITIKLSKKPCSFASFCVLAFRCQQDNFRPQKLCPDLVYLAQALFIKGRCVSQPHTFVLIMQMMQLKQLQPIKHLQSMLFFCSPCTFCSRKLTIL